MMGGYVVHFWLWKAYVADLASHLVAKRAAKSQKEHSEPETCRFLVDVAQKWTGEFCRNGAVGS